MDAVEIKKDYLEWLCSLVKADKKWLFLWFKLHDIPFTWVIPMDENRAEDGKNMRYLYSLEACADGKLEAEEVENALAGPCSVMEFLVGLAKRIEDDIMYDADSEDRTYKWFWEMIGNLGLDIYDNEHYTDKNVCDIVDRFLSRKYSKNGVGNVFRAPAKSGQDIRFGQIWEQVQAWSNGQK